MSYVINDHQLKCLYLYTGCEELKYNKTKTKKNETSTDGEIELIKND